MNAHALLPLIALALLAGCATPRIDPLSTVPAGAPAWPPPPERARVVHVADITRHDDLFDEGGFWTRVASTIGGPRETGLVRPYAVATYPGDGLLVADPGRRCVHFYHWAERRYVALGERLEGGLPSPVGVAVAADGSILVSDSRRGAIERFDIKGRHLGAFGTDAGIQRPAGLAIDAATGEVFVADVLAHAIVVLDQEGTVLRRLGGPGAAPGQFNFPAHLALDTEGNLLVADSMNFRIQRLARDGMPLGTYGQASNARGDFAHPKGVAGLDAHTFVAVEGLYDALVFFDDQSRLLMNMGGAGSGPGEFWLPSGLASDASRHLLFVADSYNARVQVFRVDLDVSSPQEVAP